MCTLSNSIIVPFLDKTTIDISYARKILKKYDESLLSEMKRVDIEDIVSKENIVVKKMRISQDSSVHGMIVCNKSDILLWDDINKNYKTVFCEGKTIYIDSFLTSIHLSNRYRFTLAHEFAHWILHRKIINKLSKEKKMIPYLSCTERDIKNEQLEKVEANCEWQANYLAGAILMPYLPLKNYCKEHKLMSCNDVYRLEQEIDNLSKIYGVSSKAMIVRLKQLGYIKN